METGNALMTVDHELFSVYELDGTLVMDHPDEDTGELVPTPIRQLPVPKQLAGIGFAIRNAERHRDNQLTFLKEQVAVIRKYQERAREIADKVIGQMRSMGDGLLKQLHQQGMAAVDTKKRPKLAISGCGHWAVNTKAATMDCDEWNGLDEDAQAEIALAHKDLFEVETVTVITPNKTGIRKAIQGGRTVDGFNVIDAEDHVVFKVEKGTGLPPVGAKPMIENKAGE